MRFLCDTLCNFAKKYLDMARRKKKKSIINNFEQLKTRAVTVSWFTVVLAILFFIGRYVIDDTSAKENIKGSDNLSLEQVNVPAGMENAVCRYKGFTVYFNPRYHIPNCVIYELTADKAQGALPRAKNFVADETVEGCAQPSDYQYSGYDRGHMAPAGDMKWDAQAMEESFYMTNICPQVKSLNTGAWNSLEGRVRQWAKRDGALIVATGPILSRSMPTIGGKAGIAVPPKFYKVILAHKANPVRAIAFIYDNEKSGTPLSKHVVSVDDVERATGIDFFASLPDDIEDRVESVSDLKQWDMRAK